jgi:ribonuclease HI
MTELEVYTDGAARGNPGRSASGYSVYDKDRLVMERVVYNGVRTNNYAEYMAVIEALKWCRARFDGKGTRLKVYSDSQIVVKQATGSYKTKSGLLKPLHEELKRLCGCFLSVEFRNVPRSSSLVARVDRKLNTFLDGLERQESGEQQH